jgi:hypothetical protein
MNAHRSLFKDVTKDPDTILMKNINKVFQYIEKQAPVKSQKPELSFNEIKAIHKEVSKTSIKLKQKKIPINLTVAISPPAKKIPINLKVVKPIPKKKVTEGHLQITHVDFRYQMYVKYKTIPDKPILEDCTNYLDVKGKTQEQINVIVHKEIDRLIEVEADSSPILEAWLKEGSVQIKMINQKDLPEYVDRTLIPMYGAKRGYSFTGDNVKFDTGQGECVYDFLMATYGKEKRLKHHITCRADLLKIMDRKSYSQGVRAIDLRKFCIFIKVPMYGIDLNQKVFIKLTAEELKEMNITPQRALPPLIFMLANAHMYPITDKPFRKCISEWAKEYTLSVSSTIASDNKVEKNKK